MGQKASGLVKDLTSRSPTKADRAPRQDEKNVSLAPEPSPTVKPMKSMPNIPAPQSVIRLPTPEYDANDVKKPLVETIVSPVSPASSPDLPADPKTVTTRKPVGDAASQVRHAKSTPTLVPKAATPSFPARPPMGLPASPAAGRTANQFPARTTSKLGDEHRPPAAAGRREPAGPMSQPLPKQREQPRQVLNGARTISENGSTASEETVKPRAQEPSAANGTAQTPHVDEGEPEDSDMTDNPGAALFPRNWYTPLVADEVMDARPLESKHFRCLTGHRYMTAARQRFNPIACRTCGTKDRIVECYICSACHLNVCPKCNARLRRLRGDLEQVLRQLREAEEEAESREILESAREVARPDSETFAVPSTEPPLAFVIEAQ